MRRNEFGFVFFGLWVFDRGQWEVPVELGFVILLGEGVTAVDVEGTTVNAEFATIFKMFTFYKIFGVGLSGLIQGKFSWEFLPVEIHGENVLSTIIWVMDLSNINGVICKIIMKNVLLFTETIKSQNFSIIF